MVPQLLLAYITINILETLSTNTMALAVMVIFIQIMEDSLFLMLLEIDLFQMEDSYLI